MEKKYAEQLTAVRARHKELEQLLQDSAVLANPERLRTITREYQELGEIVDLGEQLGDVGRRLIEARKAVRDFAGSEAEDATLRALAKEELAGLEREQGALELKIREALTPEDPLDKKNVIVEIRAGTGGEEAALFAGELFRMLGRAAERKGWATRLISASRTDIGGFKEVIFSVEGRGAFRFFKYESGVHRIQRIPETEKSGRVHTSTATVAVLPEADEVDVKIDPKDVKVETSTAGGHGGL
ncbi:MAG: PCRF domain-containing protein, partial [Patescibacteria group bacterium]